MRLLNLLNCGGRPSPAEEAPPLSGPTEERETAGRRSRPAASSSHCQKAGSKASSSSTAWRPSLAAISENAAQSKVASPASARRSDKTAVGRRAKAKAKAGDARRILPRSHSDEYEQVSSMVPAFTPTAFLF